ncbi:MAG: hypothetical protein ACXV2C_02140 [Candidatus Bathyarchaeia archaeon]
MPETLCPEFIIDVCRANDWHLLGLLADSIKPLNYQLLNKGNLIMSNYTNKPSKRKHKGASSVLQNALAPSTTSLGVKLFGGDNFEESKALSDSLVSELTSPTPSLSNCLKLIAVMLVSNAFGKVDTDGPFDWFDKYVGRSHSSRYLFKGAVLAARIGIQLRIPPTTESFSLLLVLNGVLPKFREEILRLGQASSGQDIPDVETILKIISGRNWAKKDKANRDADRLFSRFIQVLSARELAETVVSLKKEVFLIGQDTDGILALSLAEKQYLILKTENHLNCLK